MDALSSLIALLKPQAIVPTVIHGAGRWGIRYAEFGHPSFALMLKGSCWLAAEGEKPVTLREGDFVLFPRTPRFVIASEQGVRPKPMEPSPSGKQLEVVRYGDEKADPEVTMLGGYFTFDPVNAPLLLDLLPRMLHTKSADPGIQGVAPVVEFLRREAGLERPGQVLVMKRLVEILLVEALRAVPVELSRTGLLAGLRDSRVALALSAIHTRMSERWTLPTLAREAGLSRSSFAERFARVVGLTPLDYVLQWRLAVAKELLARGEHSVSAIAAAVGYESASGFSTAFSREVGVAPRKFAQRLRAA